MSQNSIPAISALMLMIGLISGCATPVAKPTADLPLVSEPRLIFSDNPARQGDAVGVRVTGLKPGAEAIVRAKQLRRWQADTLYLTEARFRADADGVVDLTNDAPIEGRWSSADRDALFWTQRTTESPPPDDLELHEIRVQVSDPDGTLMAEDSLYYPPALVEVEETPLGDGFPGAFVMRQPGADSRPAIILLGGSEGNDGAARNDAPLWAERGYVAVGLPYYSPAWGDQPQQIPGLPRGFANIPLDTLLEVRDALQLRDDVDADRIGLYGISKGAEMALAAASRIDGFAAVAAIAPSDVIWEGWGAGSTAGETPSFSWQGEPLNFVPYVGIERALGGVPEDERVAMRVPHADGRAAHPDQVEAARIRVEDIDEPVFLLGGGRDQVWDSGAMAARIAAARANAGLETETLIFAEASHGISGPPQNPTRTRSVEARRAGWSALQAFFERTLKGRPAD